MKVIRREHRNAVKLTAKERNSTILVESFYHPIGGALQTEVRKDSNYYYFLTYGRWSNACAITHDEYQQLGSYENDKEFLNINAIDVI